MPLTLTRRTAISGLAGIAALPWLPHAQSVAALAPEAIYSHSMQQALQTWLSYRDEYLRYGVEPMSALGTAERRAFLDEPWPGQRAMTVARLNKYTDRLLWQENCNTAADAEAVCWVLDQFYTPQRLPWSEWALEYYSDWSEQAYQLAHKAHDSCCRGHIPDRVLDRMRVWRNFTAQLRSSHHPAPPNGYRTPTYTSVRKAPDNV